jgi:hypothetical protein
LPHGKYSLHGKGFGHCRASPVVVHKPRMHGNIAFAVRFDFVVRHIAFSFVFPFYFISSNTYIYF